MAMESGLSNFRFPRGIQAEGSSRTLRPEMILNTFWM